MDRIEKVLVANRGEIAVRIIRALRELGRAAVAVYSTCDRGSEAVALADEAYCIGPPEPAKSYLNQPAILEVARRSGADAVHPGYGFLSENASFATACREAGLRFIGPDPETIDLMGNKLNARTLATAHGVPVVPGSDHPLDDPNEALAEARRIGFPIMIKAAAGGGGKGMRRVDCLADFSEACTRASSEARTAFGDGSGYLERFFPTPRHIEFQIVADHHGSFLHLFERECSIQRRHQKVIEETPSCALDSELRERMGEAALRIAKASNYKGVGTVEFLFERGDFHFLEMNTRLQVEHPITELTTGYDLVKAQILLCEGRRLEEVFPDPPRQYGHALECRIYAEDPRTYLPCPGRIRCLRVPDGPFVRNDSYASSGTEVPRHYDPLISKLAVWGRTRTEAIGRMQRALGEYVLTGISTNLPLHRAVLAHEAFKGGDYDTNFLARYQPLDHQPVPSGDAREAAHLAAALAVFRQDHAAPPPMTSVPTGNSHPGWKGYGFYERLR